MKILVGDEREIFWIEKLNCCKEGYNFSLGGNGRRTIDREIVNKLYKSGKNIKQISNIINADEGAISTILTESGISYKEKALRAKESLVQSVAQLDKNTEEIIQIFPSIQEAYTSLGKEHSGHIASVCNGERKTAYGYKWKYM